MKVIWSDKARDEAFAIADYIALDKPGAAANWSVELFDFVERMAQFPELSRPLPAGWHREERQLFFGSYRVLVQVRAKVTTVLSVVHGARPLKGLKNTEEE